MLHPQLFHPFNRLYCSKPVIKLKKKKWVSGRHQIFYKLYSVPVNVFFAFFMFAFNFVICAVVCAIKHSVPEIPRQVYIFFFLFSF